MRILISGGHLTPALAFIEYVQHNNPAAKIFFAGRKYARRVEKQPSWEKKEVSKYAVTFIPFNSGKIGQGSIFDMLVNGLSLIRATVRSLVLIPRYKPTVFVSFGGYLAVPLAIAAWLWRVPIVTHEQTRTAGIANNFIAKLATKIAVAYPETAEYFPAKKTTIIGNPIRKTILKSSSKQPDWFTTTSKRPLLYVTGGSQGSELINTTVARSLNKILIDWVVIHQCGQATSKRNYQEELEKASNKLSKRKQSRYFVRPWISEEELAWIYSEATTMVSRAGANTTSEIAVRHIPAILIPLPFSHNDEQYLNAKALSDNGGAILLPQKKLSPKNLVSALEEILKKPTSFRRKLQKLEYNHAAAAEKLYHLVKPYHA